jgi:hypothetical protein
MYVTPAQAGVQFRDSWIPACADVTPAQAGVQFRDSWIPACAGMTDRYHDTELNNILEDISGT